MKVGLNLGLNLGLLAGLAWAEPVLASSPGTLRSHEGARPVPESAKTAHYRIQARYDETKQRIEGLLRLRWTNRQRKPTKVMALRTYLNAFSSPQSNWMKEIGRYYRGTEMTQRSLGYLHLQDIRIEDVPSGPNQWPDRSNKTGTSIAWNGGQKDPSTIWLTLPRSVGPGQSIDLNIEFSAQLPYVIARTGYSAGFVMAAQWFPKAAVYSEQGWETPEFSHHAEFFSDFADYEVAIELPQDWELVGTGEATGASQNFTPSPGRRWHHRRAQMVHDFAWSAMQDGVILNAQIQDVEIQGLMAADHPPRDAEHLALQSELLAVMRKRYGPYPWRHISFVVPPASASGAQGMEYPTFYATEPSPLHQLPAWLYTNLYDGAWTTIHEFGHQYFQGLVASDEASAPWVDEGINTLTDAIIFEDVFSRGAGAYSFLGYPMTATALLRTSLYESPITVPIDQPAKNFHSYPGVYGPTVYARCALVFLTLREICAPGSFDRALRSYVDTFAFRHPRAVQVRDFFAKALQGKCPNGDEGQFLDISAYLHQSLDLPFELDLHAQLNEPIELAPEQGWRADARHTHGSPTWSRPRTAAENSVKKYRQTLVVQRKGSPELPVEIELIYANGHKETKIWPAGAGQLFRFEHHMQRRDQAISQVRLDPKSKISLEQNKLNNNLRRPGTPLPPELQRLDQAPLSVARAVQVFLGNLLP